MKKQSTYINNFFWRTAEHIGARGVTLIVSIVLARLLSPTDYGEVAIVLVVINILSLFVDAGFSAALIQKQNADALDYSSVFYFNVICSIFLYLMLFFLAPFFSNYYKMEHLCSVLRVQGLLLIVSSLKSVQTAYVAKHMIFKKFFWATLLGTVGAAIIGIWMAYKGAGVWALVAQSLFNNTLDVIILWFTVKWRPILQFSLKRLKSLLSYGWKLFLGGLIDKCYWQIRTLIIGKRYTSSDLAFFNRGGAFPQEIESAITTGMSDILFPAMSSIQNNKDQIKSWVKRVIVLHSYVMLPILFGLAAIAEPMTRLIFTDKWLPSVPFLRLFCVMYIFSGIASANSNAAKAIGRSDIWLKINYIRAPLHLIGLALSINFGVYAIAISAVCTTIIGELICAVPSKNLIGYSLVNQIIDILPNIVASLFMALCVWALSLLGWNAILTLVVQIVFGIIIYIGISVVFRFKSFYVLLQMIKKIIKKEKSEV